MSLRNLIVLTIAFGATCAHGEDIDMRSWLRPQNWQRDAPGPVIELGPPGSFDDMHLFAPCVYVEAGDFTMYYSGSRGEVGDRVFEMGRATSSDGVQFSKQGVVLRGNGYSILTPALLRGEDGAVLRENGELRMWFSAADMTQESPPHFLRETRSIDGIHWRTPSEPLFENAYAPSVIKDVDAYRLWYVDVSADPWAIRHARSNDGIEWVRDETPCLVIDQGWETRRLFYPYVMKHGDLYLMWYGSYWTAQPSSTALGFAVSEDGVTWLKSPHNPVFRPAPDRLWESHYTTSQTVVRLEDGAWRIWYATRPAPPHVHKYFAIGTARWAGSGISGTTAHWESRALGLRADLARLLTFPSEALPLDAETHRTNQLDGFRIESVTYASEIDSRVTALLYLPTNVNGPVPGLLLACGHGGSKSSLYAQYAGQLYAKLGFACLVPDTIGEEERHAARAVGTRAHDLYEFNSSEERRAFIADRLKRSVLGKIVWDLERGLDYLEQRPEIDSKRLGVMGYSMGGATAGYLAMIDVRLRAAVISGWGFIPMLTEYGKECTLMPMQDMARVASFAEMNALVAPHCATLFLSGDSDSIMDPNGGGAVFVSQIEGALSDARRLLTETGMRFELESDFVAGADHRPLFLTHAGVQWFQRHLQPIAERRDLPDRTITFGAWVDSQEQTIERLYNTDARERGTAVVDIGAVYHSPETLACLSGETEPPSAYTWQGWVTRQTGDATLYPK